MSRSVVVKICGHTSLEDILFADHLGVEFLGVIMAERSRRRAALDVARSIFLQPTKARKVLVFGLDNDSYIQNTIQAFDLKSDMIQLPATHALFEKLSSIFSPERILPSIAVGEKLSQEHLDLYKKYPWVLFDSPELGVSPIGGGTGRVFDHQNIDTIKRPYLLAGGLNCENISDILTQINPPGVDVAGGTESAPGIKDRAKLSKFVQLVRGHHRE